MIVQSFRRGLLPNAFYTEQPYYFSYINSDDGIDEPSYFSEPGTSLELYNLNLAIFTPAAFSSLGAVHIQACTL